MWIVVVQVEAMAFVAFLFNFMTASASTCSWSNERCSVNKDCCSKSCHRAFEGVKPRCRHSSIGERCIFSFHCGNDLDCGPHFNCCAPYWKMCTKDADCCDPQHVCKPAEGFYYDRCLYPSASSKLRPMHLLTLLAVIGSSLWSCLHAFL